MLERLHIKNIAVIDEAEIEFNNGFNVLTGETGAGKSIIIDSINMVLGERTSKNLIRNGEKKAVVEALFYVNNPQVISDLEEMDIDVDDGMLILYRDINTDGKTVCKVNGSMTTASNLRDIACMLINIHGQNDNQSLLTPSAHIGFLDSYANLEIDLAAYRTQHQKVLDLQEQIDSLQFDEREKERQTDLYSYQIDEINGANLKIGEDEQLAERKKFINSIGKIAEGVNYSYSALYEQEGNVYDTLSRVVNQLQSLSEYDTNITELHERLNSAVIEIDDIIYQIRDYRDGMEFDDSEIDQIETRLDTINTLKRKYGNTIEDILSYRDEISNTLDKIIKSDEEILRLKSELEFALKVREDLASTLTKARKKASSDLAVKICNELADLDMSKVRFEVSMNQCEYNKNGCDNVEFLISVNAGEPLKPLSKIASGGEMSRIMLAIKSIFADSDVVDTMIFDEIDTGVSGRAAQKIAEKINKISANKQILCITHLAQIAAMADTHYLIEKAIEQERTFTKVTPLDDEPRKTELARIIGGAQITDTTIKAAAEMIEQAEFLRNKKDK